MKHQITRPKCYLAKCLAMLYIFWAEPLFLLCQMMKLISYPEHRTYLRGTQKCRWLTGRWACHVTACICPAPEFAWRLWLHFERLSCKTVKITMGFWRRASEDKTLVLFWLPSKSDLCFVLFFKQTISGLFSGVAWSVSTSITVIFVWARTQERAAWFIHLCQTARGER